jgi:predicted metallopeptidase
MAAVLEHLFQQQKRSVEHCTAVKSQKALELEAAREILTEVFGIQPLEVDEMIRNRFQSSDKKAPGEGHGPWPQEFSV